MASWFAIASGRRPEPIRVSGRMPVNGHESVVAAKHTTWRLVWAGMLVAPLRLYQGRDLVVGERATTSGRPYDAWFHTGELG